MFLQKRKVRGLGVRARAATALLRVFPLGLECIGSRQSFVSLAFFIQESLLFGCCGPWARGNITTANWCRVISQAPVPRAVLRPSVLLFVLANRIPVESQPPWAALKLRRASGLYKLRQHTKFQLLGCKLPRETLG